MVLSIPLQREENCQLVSWRRANFQTLVYTHTGWGTNACLIVRDTLISVGRANGLICSGPVVLLVLQSEESVE